MDNLFDRSLFTLADIQRQPDRFLVLFLILSLDMILQPGLNKSRLQQYKLMSQLSEMKPQDLNASQAEISFSGNAEDSYSIVALKTSQQDDVQSPSGSKAKDIRRLKMIFVFFSVMIIILGVIKYTFISQTKSQMINICEPYQQKYLRKPYLAAIQRLPKFNVDRHSVVIDVTYASNDYGPLPIDPLRKNTEGKKIQDVLYKDDPMRKKRTEFMEQRVTFVNSKSSYPSLFLAKYNLVSTEEQNKKGIEDNQREWERLDGKFQLSKLREELPMCLIVPSFNNNANFRIEYNLNSLFTQNYTNYKVIIVNDASTDGSGEVYRSFFRFHAIDKQRYTYIENSKRLTTLPNLYFAAMNHCSKEAIVLHIDGDDQWIGKNVLQVFNWAYQTKKAGVVYSNFYWLYQLNKIQPGFTSQYTDDQKKGNLYRDIKQKFSQQRSYRNELTFKIDPKDLQDYKGDFYEYTADHALLFPLLQLACGRVYNIPGEIHYLYNVGTDWNKRSQQYLCNQVAVDKVVRGHNKYECSQQFEKRMKK